MLVCTYIELLQSSCDTNGPDTEEVDSSAHDIFSVHSPGLPHFACRDSSYDCALVQPLLL